MKLKEVTLADIADLFDGPHATPPPADDGPVFLGIKNIREDGHLDLSDIRHIAEVDFPKWIRRVEPQLGDIVFTYEATLGRYALIPEGFRGCLGRRLALVRPFTHLVDYHYLYYYFRSPLWESQVRAHILTGATVDRIPLTKVPDFKLEIPPLDQQKRIAEIIAAYDDLLDNNNRRIALLEEAIHRLYREWFVHLRFPGYEHTPVVAGVPEGWEKRPIKTFVDLQSGFAFKSKTFDDSGQYGLVTIGNVKDGQFEPICNNRIPELPEKMPEYCQLATGDILLSLTGNIGRTCLVFGSDYLLNQRVAKLVPIALANRAFVYCFFRDSSTQKTLEQIATGVAQQNLSPVKTGKLAVMFPKETLLQSFSEFADPMIDQILILSQQNIVLAEARDALLPRLMNGSLPV